MNLDVRGCVAILYFIDMSDLLHLWNPIDVVNKNTYCFKTYINIYCRFLINLVAGIHTRGKVMQLTAGVGVYNP